MKLALYTGMRRGELFRLQWTDINFERRSIFLRNPKGGEGQNIPLNDSAFELLMAMKKEEGSPYIFPGRDGRQRTNIRLQVNRIKEKAGLPKNFRPLHGLRHVYASILASSGKVDLYALQKLLTHKEPKPTQRYAHIHDEALRKASNVLGKVVADIMDNDEKSDSQSQNI
jgi:integrase